MYEIKIVLWVLAGAMVILQILDWLQTIEISRNDSFYEAVNPFLGKNPTRLSVHVYMGIALAVKLAMAYMLPGEYAGMWMCLWIGVNGVNVLRNYRIGIRINFYGL